MLLGRAVPPASLLPDGFFPLMLRVFQDKGWLAIPGMGKPAPDHRPSRLLVQQPLVLLILCILCIDVIYPSLLQNSAKGSSIGRGSGKAVRLETSLLIRFGVCLREGSCPPGARASRPHRSGRSPAGPLCLRFSDKGADALLPPWVRAPRNGTSSAQSEAVAVARILLAEKRCGRDARAPGWASSHDRVTPRGQNCRSVPEPLVVEGSPSLFVFIRGSSFSTATCPAHTCLLSSRRRRFKSRVPRPHGLPNVMPDSEFCKRLDS